MGVSVPVRVWAPILALGLGLRLLAAFHVPVFPVVANTWDASFYHETATSLAAGEGFSFQGRPTALFPPAYPAILSAAYRVAGATPRAGQGVNVAASILLLGAAAWLAGETLGRRGATTAACVLALEPSQIVMPAFLMSETAAAAATASALAALVRFLRRGEWAWLGASALAASFAGMTRGHGFLVLPGLLLVMLVLRAAPRRPLLAALAVVVLSHGVVVAAWAARNERALGSPVLVATNGAMNLLLGNNPNARGGRADPPGGVPDTGDEIADERMARDRATAYIREHPGRFLALMPVKAARLLLPAPVVTYRAELREKWGRVPAAATLLAGQAAHVLLAGSFLGWAWRRRRGATPGERLLLVIALSVLAVWTAGHLPFLGGARYVFPVQFLLVSGIAGWRAWVSGSGT